MHSEGKNGNTQRVREHEPEVWVSVGTIVPGKFDSFL